MEDFEIEKGILKKYHGNAEEVVIPSDVHTIGRYAFQNNTSMKKLTITENVRKIEEGAFLRCYALENIMIPENLETIGIIAFSGCKNMKNVFLTDHVKTIGYNAFYGLESLQTFEIVLYKEDISDFTKQLIGSWDIYHYFLEDKIKTDVRLEAELIKRVKQKSHRMHIMPRLLKNGNAAVLAKYLSYFKKLPVEELDGYIGMAENAELRAILLNYKNWIYSPEKLDKMEEIQMDKEFGLREKTISNYRKIFKIALKNGVYYITGYKSEADTVIIPSVICGKRVELGANAFYDNRNVKSVEIEDGITEIGECAFCGCNQLTGIVIPESIRTIGRRAFQYCNATELLIPEEVTEIGEKAFERCEHITEFVLPKGISVIRECTFYNCTHLKRIVIPENVRIIETRAFHWCYRLEEAVVSEGVGKIGPEAFAWSRALKSITLPASVTEIGENAFQYCHGNLTIHAPKGSYAADYAVKNGIALIEEDIF
ncbi:MAG: leucine-rich repeat protein [Clostridia bacterium]|nr:leucine-rich repeat protein [Clostridia bacterium]